ncbi:hypothetical protein [Streptomyces sp. TLI_171]|uniref:LppU/SCO3897 family protein n=1 Tax=Streptomyces sp. TLI_171 TaxID=1938859 RepID=UPI000C177DAB|nr:hypothetical protein [Streptomyces sp. TLI_171]RKE20183.1 hypothetical protein BX266_3532 [Streptomyces sp. TLI_171]
MTTPQAPQDPTTQPPAGVPFEYAQAQQAAAAAPKRGLGKKVLSVLGVVAVGLVILAVKLGIGYAMSDKPVHAKVGECVSVTGSDNDPKVETVGCGDAKATHEVSKIVDNSFDTNACGDEFDALAQQLGSDKFVLCLTPKK